MYRTTPKWRVERVLLRGLLYSRSAGLRAGVFAISDQGTLVQGSSRIGRILLPAIAIPPDALALVIGDEGVVSVLQAGNPVASQIGGLILARFQNPDGLVAWGDGLFAESEASGPALLQSPGTDATGKIRQGMTELSNVDPATELAEMRRTVAALAANEALATPAASAERRRQTAPLKADRTAREAGDGLENPQR